MYRHVADPVVLETLIRAEHRATMAAADFTAIEHVLDREIDVDTLRLAGNFDAVAKGRHGAVRPARSTVLRDVLVPAHGAVEFGIWNLEFIKTLDAKEPRVLLIKDRSTGTPRSRHSYLSELGGREQNILL